jgi:DNA replication protein DnaD
MFEEMTAQQALWYQIQISLDMKEQFELLRDVAEHNAMFMNPEAVQQVRDARENSFETPDEDFDSLLEETFGRSISKEENQEVVDVMEMLKQDRESSKYSSVMDLDLDEVSFTPFK